jgi:trimethylamine--corrinoid protein Co-methyltransferase
MILGHPFKSGLTGGKFKLLSEGDIEQIHTSALEILEKVGIKVESPQLLEFLKKGGAKVKPGSEIVKLPREMVEQALQVAPKEVNLYGRREEYNLYLIDERVYLGTGGAAIKILDLETGRARSTTLKDLADLARLVDHLDNIHFFLRPVVATDISVSKLDVNTFYTALSNTYKHVMGSASTVEGVRNVIELASLVARGEDKLREAPFISFVTSWMVSPLKVDTNATNVLFEIVKNGIPVALSSAPMAGSTAPVTIAGILTQVHAEELSGIVLTQLIREGSPILYGPVPAAVYMRTMGYAGGAIETALMNVGAVQMAHYIGVPIYSDAGLTDSKIPDIQAGYEKMASILLVALAGGNYIHHAAGMLESMLTVAHEQYVIDNDIIGMTLRVLQGIKVDKETIAQDVIEAVGPGGNFLIQPHTIKYMRSGEYFVPRVADREERSQWENAGSLNGWERARRRAKEILSKPVQNLIPEDIDREIRRRFEILLPREF